MPMIVTDATLPGNPIVFVNQSFINLCGYTMDELLGQDPHFMNGGHTDPEAVRSDENAIQEGRDETLEILQYQWRGFTTCSASRKVRSGSMSRCM